MAEPPGDIIRNFRGKIKFSIKLDQAILGPFLRPSTFDLRRKHILAGHFEPQEHLIILTQPETPTCELPQSDERLTDTAFLCKENTLLLC